MTPAVRAFRPADAPAVADLLRAGAPYQVVSAELIEWQAGSSPPAERYALLVAEHAGELVGAALTGVLHESAEPGLGFANVIVHPWRRGRGRRLRPAGRRRGAARQAGRGHRVRQGGRRSGGGALRRAPGFPARTALPAAEPGPGLGAAAGAAHDQESTTVAMVDGVVAAFSFVLTDGRDRCGSGMTGTRPVHRRTGLARLVKAAALCRARDAGHREAFTTNDAGNEGMLAINRRLGYTVVGAVWRYQRKLCP